ncbi:hypothetical protein COV05_04305 [Candidatus Uhrbacteria bacterium CG10_big_fil_rev_8_21_14_0_10_48_16]|uniref:AAA+ ATPase domain-containing protein n=1 Tax=Candidatus Uhrbacteria bacterium CG10_big_fil_rev_8_21_14_0_10_48_16 TaxID=1975038 RepID=A0A2M8LGI5_9BACT|nr:MAG: hypothetical protein COV05_04305 [Candidatus Uhrbacteria bacterium CG10_big_fil_rev_8_21_14_0_10_48_16]
MATDIYLQIIEALLSDNQHEAEKKIKELIKNSEKRGHINVAKKLRQLKSSLFSNGMQTSSAHTSNSLATLQSNSMFEWRRSKLNLDNIVLSDQQDDIFKQITESYRKSDLLLKKGIVNDLKVLLYGPPGTGKTLFVYALAGALDLPVMHIHIDSLISSYLGETGKNIRAIFDEANKRNCILFLDEFDAVAKQRDDAHELGELKRVVTVLLQNIDEFLNSSILFAATNHEHLLDKAVWRRFNYRCSFSLPTQEQLKSILSLYINDSQNIDSLLVSKIAVGLSGADLRQVVESALRRSVLEESVNSLQSFVIEEMLKTYRHRKIEYGRLKEKQALREAILSLQEEDSKKYTFAYLEQLTGIAHSSLHNLVKKYAS